MQATAQVDSTSGHHICRQARHADSPAKPLLPEGPSPPVILARHKEAYGDVANGEGASRCLVSEAAALVAPYSGPKLHKASERTSCQGWVLPYRPCPHPMSC